MKMKKQFSYFAIIFVFALSILACSVGGSEDGTNGGDKIAPLPDNVLFQDDFSDTSSGWDRYDGAEEPSDLANQSVRPEPMAPDRDARVASDRHHARENENLRVRSPLPSVPRGEVGAKDSRTQTNRRRISS